MRGFSSKYLFKVLVFYLIIYYWILKIEASLADQRRVCSADQITC